MGPESGVAVSYGVGRRRSSDPALLWLWCSPAAVARIQPPAWELSYAVGSALKNKKQKKKRKEKEEEDRKKDKALDVINFGENAN